MAGVLYVFLGWALVTLWRDLKRQGQWAATRQAPPILLRSADEHGDFRFEKPEIIIGRDSGQDVSISDLTVSTQHARLSYHHNQWWLEDLDSTNGTFLNQEPVTGPTVVDNGDQVRCGQVVFDISIEEKEVE
jgi:pSer/pThr/pTyr-binding forkhead associated (FHA) protein